jgi:hypothetical protein
MYRLAFTLLIIFAYEAYSEVTNQWGSPVFGAQLSISVSNNVISVGSKILLFCVTTNCSTNGICFTRSEAREMYEVSIINASGKIFELNDPDNAGNHSEKGGKINPSESFKCPVPLHFDERIEPGNYKIIAKQKIYLFRKPDRQDIQRGELASNFIDVRVE